MLLPTGTQSDGSASQPQAASTAGDAHQTFFSSSEVPAAPTNTAVGGKASLQPKRTPVSDREIEAILSNGLLSCWVDASDRLTDGQGRMICWTVFLSSLLVSLSCERSITYILMEAFGL
ncbi:hypothetical protein HHK36_027525 [Tetracentron sinense]|uniref:Uncharacterized protein n=1 Tax=Tetracentron sinense TaxID=13715 RepID=A0A834YJA6_TETSI|nr:hypothetical protein HHK36_027525 [Tetracentron sinense]